MMRQKAKEKVKVTIKEEEITKAKEESQEEERGLREVAMNVAAITSHVIAPFVPNERAKARGKIGAMYPLNSGISGTLGL